MIKPKQQDDTFLADVQRWRGKAGVRLWWLGQSGFLVQAGDEHLLFDPYLSDSLTTKYASTDKPHVRMSERVVDPARLDFIDIVTSSHTHTDHLDRETLLSLRESNPQIRMIIPEANRAFVAERLGTDAEWPRGLAQGESVAIGSFQIAALPAAHESLDLDKDGRCLYLGYVVDVAGVRIYHSGDTMLYQGMTELLGHLQPDIMLLPINGSAPERRVAGNLDGREAAQLAHDSKAKLAVPMHYDLFEFNTASPEEFVQACTELKVPYRVLELGERLDWPT